MKVVIFFVNVIIFSTTAAYADSWCDYDSGRIGTKAIGYVAPYEIDDLEYDFEKGICRLTVAMSPTEDANTEALPCEAFREMPSYGIPYNAGGFSETDRKYLASEYFTFLIFAYENGMSALELKTGERRWVGKFFSDDRETASAPFEPWQSGQPIVGRDIYNSPSFDDVTTEFTADGEALRRFYEFVFQHSDNPASYVDRALRNEGIEGFYFEVNYRAIRQITGDDGTQWIEAEEQLAINPASFPNFVYRAFKEDGPLAIMRSDVIRIVFIPMKAADGTVISVIGDGACD